MHALLACAGVADGTPGIEKINFVGPQTPPGSMTVCWRATCDRAAPPSGSSRRPPAWAGRPASSEQSTSASTRRTSNRARPGPLEHGYADYFHSKQAVCAYVARPGLPASQAGHPDQCRLCPGPTDTPLAQANKEMWLGFGADYREEAGCLEASRSSRWSRRTRSCSYCSDAARLHLGHHPDQRRTAAWGSGDHPGY